MTRVFITPVDGKLVKDPFGRAVPAEGRYVSYGPYWIRLKNRGLIAVVETAPAVKDVESKLRKGYFTRKGSK